MRRTRTTAAICCTCLLSFLSGSVFAQDPVVHLPLDGNVRNLGSAGEGELVVPGTAEQPRFVDGISGQGLAFGKGGAVAIPYEFNQSQEPRATVTMWIKIDADSQYERELFSLGPGSGLLLRVTPKRTMNVRSYAQVTHDQPFPLGEWVFVAAVVDNEAGSIYIQQNDAPFTATGLKMRTPGSLTVTAPGGEESQHYVFVGADDFNSAGREMKHVALDDVRLYAKALTAAEIEAVRNSTAPRIADSKNRGGVTDSPDIVDPRRETPTSVGSGILPTDTRASRDFELNDPVENTPDRNLSAPDDSPAAQLEEEIDTVRNARPPVEDATKLYCEAKTTNNVDFSATSSAFPTEFIDALKTAQSCDLDLTVVTINEKGQWLIATMDQVAHSRDLPAPMLATLVTVHEQHGGLTAADVSESGAWILAFRSSVYQSGLSANAERQAQEAAAQSGLAYFDFHPSDPNKYVMISRTGTVTGSQLPSEMLRALADLPSSKRKVRAIRFGRADSWALLGSGSWFVTDNIASQVRRTLGRQQRAQRRLDHLVLASSDNSYALYSAKSLDNTSGTVFSRVEQGFPFTTTSSGRSTTALGSIWARMDAHDLKAVSIAFIQNNRVAWARGYGYRDGNEPESYVFADTTFEAASISKPIATYGLLQLVEAGKLSLTEAGVLEDIEILMTSGPKATYRDNVDPGKSNLIQLLQHCAALCYEGTSMCGARNPIDNGAHEYPLSTNPMPTTIEMILGVSPGDANHKLKRSGIPGQAATYSSANFLPVQALIEIHGNGFENHMNPILSGLDMDLSTFDSPYPKRNDGNHVTGWLDSNVTRTMAYGEMAGASLVSTPTDIAKFVIEVNRSAQEPDRNGILSFDMVQTFLGRDRSIYGTQTYPTCANPRRFGLSINRDAANNGWNGKEIYWHTGSHRGYRARMVGLPQEGSGIVVLVSGERDDADAFYQELLASVVQVYGF